jgi:hypothetical protein
LLRICHEQIVNIDIIKLMDLICCKLNIYFVMFIWMIYVYRNRIKLKFIIY